MTKRLDFNGVTYEAERDGVRLNKQQARVRNVMSDGQWRTLAQLSNLTGDPQASVSARLRDLRKPRFGGYRVQRQYLGNGLWQYRIGA